MEKRKRRRFTAEYKSEAVKRLEQENEILKRAAAFFAREAVAS